jgi:hypothetical protein
MLGLAIDPTLRKNRKASMHQLNHDRIFRNLREPGQEYVDKKAILQRFYDLGILKDDLRIKRIRTKLDEISSHKVTREQLAHCIQDDMAIVEKTLAEEFVVP